MSTYTNDVAHQTQTASCQAEQRAYLRKLIETRIVATNGERPSFDDCSHIEQRAVKLIEESAQSGAPSSSIAGKYRQKAIKTSTLPVDYGYSQPWLLVGYKSHWLPL